MSARLNQSPNTLTIESAEPQRSSAHLEPPNEAAIHELWLQLEALRSFFEVRNHPIAENDVVDDLGRDWSAEAAIATGAALRGVNLAIACIDYSGGDATRDRVGLEEVDFAAWNFNESSSDSRRDPETAVVCDVIDELCMLCAQLSAANSSDHLDVYWFSSFKRTADRLAALVSTRLYTAPKSGDESGLRQLRALCRGGVIGEREICEVRNVMESLREIISIIQRVESALLRDRPLKETLSIFTLVNDRTNHVLQEVQALANRAEGESEDLFNVLDGLKFALSMELKKVFSFELVGLSTLKQASSIYAKVENSHGLLRDAFQQSLVALAQLLDPSAEGASIFDSFQNRLKQSVELRQDLWILLTAIRKAEKERDMYPIARLRERLTDFKRGSLRYLMFKDWEACERFIEEVDAARGAVELAPVLNRFSAYLETLHGQVSMRAVLADHPFDYTETGD
jgi:hypothetical protein